jgi:tetrahydromethanopterin S-methyltransferase subunit G
MSENEQRQLIRRDEEHDQVNRLREVVLPEELDEMKASLEALMEKVARSDQKPQISRDLGRDAPILFLIVRV